jgi:hypothetical protein
MRVHRGEDAGQIGACGEHPILALTMTRNSQDHQELYSDVLETNGSSGQSIAAIAERIRGSGASLIVIDGLPGAGKSTLAASLSALLTIRAVHLDDYLAHECVGFTDYLRYEDLQRALLRRPVIVEGVCMLDVLDRLTLRPDQFVYLQAPFAEQHLDRSHPLVREVRAYTDRSHPVERANLVLARSECGAKSCKTPAGRQFSIDAYLMKNRSQISLGLAAAGMIMLAMGAIFVVVGLSAHGEPLTGVGRNFSLVGTGLATMLMSCLWIFLARLARPSTRVHSPRSKQ